MNMFKCIVTISLSCVEQLQPVFRESHKLSPKLLWPIRSQNCHCWTNQRPDQDRTIWIVLHYHCSIVYKRVRVQYKGSSIINYLWHWGNICLSFITLHFLKGIFSNRKPFINCHMEMLQTCGLQNYVKILHKMNICNIIQTQRTKSSWELPTQVCYQVSLNNHLNIFEFITSLSLSVLETMMGTMTIL